MSSQCPFNNIPTKLLPPTAPRRPNINIKHVAIALRLNKVEIEVQLYNYFQNNNEICLPNVCGENCNRYGTDNSTAYSTTQKYCEAYRHHIKIRYQWNRYRKNGADK